MPEVRPHLKNLVDATRDVDGYIAYHVAEDLFEPGVVRFSELWPDRETLERHLEAAHIGPWLAAAKGCGMMAEEFTVFDLAGSRSIG